MDYTSKIALKQQLVRQKLCHSYSHQVAISISSCVAVSDSDSDGNSDAHNSSTTRNWFDHMWCAAPSKKTKKNPGKDNISSLHDDIVDNEDDSVGKKECTETEIEVEIEAEKDLNQLERATEEVLRKGIKDNLLVLLEMQLHSVTSDPLRAHLIPVLQCLIGRLYDKLGDYESAIKCYSMGKFVKSRRVMRCLAAKYNAMIAESSSVNALLDVSKFLHWSQNMSPAIGLMAFRLLAEELLVEDSFNSGILFGSVLSSHTSTSTSQPSTTQSTVNRSSTSDPLLKLNLTGVQLASTVASSVLNNMIICEPNREVQAVTLSIELLNDLKSLLRSSFGTDKDLMISNSDDHIASLAASASSLLSPINTSSFSTYFSKPVSPLPLSSVTQAWYSFSPAVKTSSKSNDDKSPKANIEHLTEQGKTEKSVPECGLIAGIIGNNIISNYIDSVGDTKYQLTPSTNSTPVSGTPHSPNMTDNKGKGSTSRTASRTGSPEKHVTHSDSTMDNTRTLQSKAGITESQGPKSLHDVGRRGSTSNGKKSRSSSEIFDAPNTPLFGLKVSDSLVVIHHMKKRILSGVDRSRVEWNALEFIGVGWRVGRKWRVRNIGFPGHRISILLYPALP
jgi:hypothetical protein